MASNLDTVAGLSDQKQKIEQYKAALTDVLDSGSTQQCKQFVEHSAPLLELLLDESLQCLFFTTLACLK